MKIIDKMGNMNTIYISLTLVILLILSGCQSGEPKVNTVSRQADSSGQLQDNPADTETDSASEESSHEKMEIMMLPSPDEILNEVLGSDIKYNPSIVNSLKNDKKYLDVKSQALNLGIYLTDLAYINLNDDKTEAFQYFRTIRQLSQKLNIYQPFYGDLFNRVQKNIANQDSINSIFREVYYNMLDVLEQAEQNDIYAYVVTGAMIESLYIPAVTIENSEDYSVIATKMFEQKFIINNFYEHLLRYKGEKYIDDVLLILSDVRNILNNAETKSTKKVVVQKDKGNFTITGGDEIVVTEKMLNTISNKVKEIRSDIVNSK